MFVERWDNVYNLGCSARRFVLRMSRLCQTLLLHTSKTLCPKKTDFPHQNYFNRKVPKKYAKFGQKIRFAIFFFAFSAYWFAYLWLKSAILLLNFDSETYNNELFIVFLFFLLNFAKR